MIETLILKGKENFHSAHPTPCLWMIKGVCLKWEKIGSSWAEQCQAQKSSKRNKLTAYQLLTAVKMSHNKYTGCFDSQEQI